MLPVLRNRDQFGLQLPEVKLFAGRLRQHQALARGAETGLLFFAGTVRAAILLLQIAMMSNENLGGIVAAVVGARYYAGLDQLSDPAHAYVEHLSNFRCAD